MTVALPIRRMPVRNNWRALTACLSIIVLLASRAANAALTVTIDGSDWTGLAMPVDQAGVPTGNANALASKLGLTVSITGSSITVIDSKGTSWHGNNGDRILVSSRSLPLDAAVDVEGPNVYLPLDTLALLSGYQFVLSADHSHADFTRASAQGARPQVSKPAAESSQTSQVDGWEDISIPKTQVEIANSNSDFATSGGATNAHNNLPSSHDAIQVQSGYGYVQGADFGMTLNGAGSAYGDGVAFNGLVAVGPYGLNFINGWVLVNDWTNQRRYEAGTLFSELYGTSNGVRLTLLRNSQTDSSFAFYAGNDFGQQHVPVLAFSKEVTIDKHLAVSTEFGTDGSYLIKQRVQDGPLSVYGFERWLHLGDGGAGVFGNYRISKGVSLQAGSSNEGTGANRNDFRNVGLTFPLTKHIDITVSRSEALTGPNENNVTGIALGFPLRGIRFSTAYQWGDTGNQLPTFSTLITRQQTLSLTAGYNPTPRTRLDYEVMTRWEDNGESSEYDQLVSQFRLAHATTLQVISAFPDLIDQNVLRICLKQDLSATRSVSLDYGVLQPYEPIAPSMGDRGFMLMYTESWEIKTPARGGTVTGKVLDALGRPVRGVMVRLGSYSDTTDQTGAYNFMDVPSGSYRVYVDEYSLPANFRQNRETTTVLIDSCSRETINFSVTPQGTVAGRICWDKNVDGTYKAGDGIAGVFVRLGNEVTTTDDNGAYAFYNVDPGTITISLDVTKLQSDQYAASDSEIKQTLAAGQSLSGLDFRIGYRDKPVVFQGGW